MKKCRCPVCKILFEPYNEGHCEKCGYEACNSCTYEEKGKFYCLTCWEKKKEKEKHN